MSGALSSGGKASLHLQSGDYVFRPSDREDIAVLWDPEDDVRVKLEVKDESTNVSAGNTPLAGIFTPKIELPRKTD